MLINRLGGGAENLDTELTAQDTLITNITESLVGRLAGADATANDILEGKKAYVGQTLITGTYDPSTADENLVPSNIRNGVTIFDVLGTLVEGKAGVDYGEVTLSSSQDSVEVNHSLGVIPSFIALIPTTYRHGDYYVVTLNINGLYLYVLERIDPIFSTSEAEKTSEKIIFLSPSTESYHADTYKWFALA